MGTDRLSRARAALVRAEESVGLSAAHYVNGADRIHVMGGADVIDVPRQSAWTEANAWNVPESLSSLFPYGLIRGMTLGISGSRLASLLMAGIVSGRGGWVACLGIADMGWGAACLLGIDLERTVYMPGVTSAITANVIATAIEGFDAVLVGGGVLVDSREQRLLSRRALSHGTVLLVEDWSTREHVTGRFIGVDGLHRGRGHISELRMELSRPGIRAVPIRVTSEGWEVSQGLRSLASEENEGAPHRENGWVIRSFGREYDSYTAAGEQGQKPRLQVVGP